MKNKNNNTATFCELVKGRKKSNLETLPEINSIVTFMPLETYGSGVKVLIEGKLFIAIMNSKVPLGEDIIALVTNTEPFTISLNLIEYYSKNRNVLLNKVLQKFDLIGNDISAKVLSTVIEVGKPLIKSKIRLLAKLLKYSRTKIEGLELALLIDMLWVNNENYTEYINELFENLFNYSFENICEKLFKKTEELLFADIPQSIVKLVKSNLIYKEEVQNINAIGNKSLHLYEIIIKLNDFLDKSQCRDCQIVKEFIKLSTKYIFQKSILKQYDYYPDSIIVQRENELILVKYDIRKYFSEKGEPSYSVNFKNNSVPYKLKGILRNNSFLAKTNVAKKYQNDLNKLSSNLKKKLNVVPTIVLTNENEFDLAMRTFGNEINQLIS